MVWVGEVELHAGGFLDVLVGVKLGSVVGSDGAERLTTLLN